MACEWRPRAASRAHAARGLRTASRTRRVAAAAHPPSCRRNALRSMQARTHARHPGCGQPRLWHTQHTHHATGSGSTVGFALQCYPLRWRLLRPCESFRKRWMGQYRSMSARHMCSRSIETSAADSATPSAAAATAAGCRGAAAAAAVAAAAVGAVVSSFSARTRCANNRARTSLARPTHGGRQRTSATANRVSECETAVESRHGRRR